jgi:4-hydroxy-2-oxoheptanedioate aldolase
MATFGELLKGGPQLGLGVFYPSPGVIERIGPDWDWIWIDGQHGEHGYTDVLTAVRACNLVKRPALVRVPGHEGGLIGLALDTAADAVMVPMVSDASQAEKIVQAAKFAPLGSRSFGGRRPIDLFGRTYAHQDQPQPLLICQIENEKGLKNVDAIAAVEGVDGLFFGGDDMALGRNLSMDQPVPKGYFDEALENVARAAQVNGKIIGGVFANDQAMSNAVKMGYTLNVGMADVSILASGSKETTSRLRKCLGQTIKDPGDDTAWRPGIY